MSEELKPCPFCGGEATLDHVNGSHGELWDIFCSTRSCEIRPCTVWFTTEQDAIEAWNRRVSE